MRTRKNGGCVKIRDAYNRCYGARAVYACAVTSQTREEFMQTSVFCSTAPRLFFLCCVVRAATIQGSQFPVEDSHGKLVSAEGLEVSL
jgi:hypothetical protein